MLMQESVTPVDRNRIESAIERARRARNAEVSRLLGLAFQYVRRNIGVAVIAALTALKQSVRNPTRHA